MRAWPGFVWTRRRVRGCRVVHRGLVRPGPGRPGVLPGTGIPTCLPPTFRPRAWVRGSWRLWRLRRIAVLRRNQSGHPAARDRLKPCGRPGRDGNPVCAGGYTPTASHTAGTACRAGHGGRWTVSPSADDQASRSLPITNALRRCQQKPRPPAKHQVLRLRASASAAHRGIIPMIEHQITTPPAGIMPVRALHLAGVWQIRSAPRMPGGDSVQARRMPARSRRHW